MTTRRYAVTADGAEQDGTKGFLLLELNDPDPAEIAALGRELDLPADALEDAVTAHKRPQLRALEGVLAVVVLTPTLGSSSDVELGQVVALVTEKTVALVVRDAGQIGEEVLERLAAGATQPAEVLLALIGAVTPDLDEVLFGLDEDVAEVEAEVFSPVRQDRSRAIYKLKRELLELRRATAPLSDVVDRLATEPSCPVPEDLREAFVEQHRRTTRTASGVEHLDGLIDGVLDAQLAQIGVRQNEDQRKISAWAAIGLVPTMVGAVYGMNFEHMPELSWQLGYPAAMALILVACLALYRGFRRNGWLGTSARDGENTKDDDA